ncbi:hypothetical protein O6H91_21G026500 [Diphasiastrum complanatum]|uniref:Uncharacterized protein n=1 Tax=Diphasiastrum complanatum TaxID=34168 RepID=A0ACC2AIY6_DIPCM|nr:hypothetical protein O6H91_21G026500 [Diphasiastrum complanatum]
MDYTDSSMMWPTLSFTSCKGHAHWLPPRAEIRSITCASIERAQIVGPRTISNLPVVLHIHEVNDADRSEFIFRSSTSHMMLLLLRMQSVMHSLHMLLELVEYDKDKCLRVQAHKADSSLHWLIYGMHILFGYQSSFLCSCYQ